MASGSNYLTTYYAKRIIGDSAASNATSALLQIGDGVTSDTWILHKTGRNTNYGLKYVYDYTPASGGNAATIGDTDKIEFIGKGTTNAYIELDTGNTNISGNLTVIGTSKLTDSVGINIDPDSNYNLLVDGNIRFNIGTVNGNTIDDGALNKHFVIGRSGQRYLAFGGGGIQAYGSNDAVTTLYLNYSGGQTYVGGNEYVIGKMGIGYNPDTNGNSYKLYVNGTSYFSDNVLINLATTNSYGIGGNALNLGLEGPSHSSIMLKGADVMYGFAVNTNGNWYFGTRTTNSFTDKTGDVYLLVGNTTSIYPNANNTITLGTSSKAFKDLYLGDADGAGIYYKGTKNTYRMIRFIDNTGDTYGNGISIGGGGLALFGSGESANTLITNLSLTSGGTEQTYISSDNTIWFYPSQNTYNADTYMSMSGSQLLISGTTSGGMAADSTNPKITFVEKGSTQPVHLVYTDSDTYRAPAGLKIVGGTSATPAWLEVEGQIIAGNRVTTTRPSSLSSTDRIIITPYYHTDGPWKITSSDDGSNAYLALYYGSTELMRIKHDGTQSLAWKGNAATATKLATARAINGTNFDGSAAITTANWGTARNITIKDADSTNAGTAVSVNGSAAVTLLLPSTIKASLSGNATSANYLSTYVANSSSSPKTIIDGLQRKFADIPKSVGTAVKVVLNSHYMGFGYFLSGDNYNTTSTAYGGWFVAAYDVPHYIGIGNGNWSDFILLHSGSWRKTIFANKNVSRSTLTVSDSSWAITSGTDIFGLSFKDTALTYTPSGGSATASSDTGNLCMWLTCASTSNTVSLNMRIDGTFQSSGFIGGSYTGTYFYSKHGTINITASNNGVTSNTAAYGYYGLDKNGKDFTRVMPYVLTSGETRLYLQIRNHSGSAYTSYGGIIIKQGKSANTITYEVTDGANFRSAIGAGTSSLTIGTTASTAAAGNHTHGNITNAGGVSTAITIANGDYIIIGDSSDSGKLGKGPAFNASTETKCLTQKGTWAAFNNYSHPTTAGNKHIPSGGSSGQFLGWDSAGTAKWVNNPNTNTTYTFATGGTNGTFKYTPSGGSATEVSIKGLSDAAYRAVYTLSAVGDSGWSTSANRTKVPDMSFMAYWSGAYSGTASNLTYCKHGAFGTAATHAHGDYAAASHDHSRCGVAASWLYFNNNNELNFGGTYSTDSTIYIGYRATDSRPKPTIFSFGGGEAQMNCGHIYISASKYIYMKYSSTNYAVLYNHNNGNVSLRACGAGLYIGYENTTLVNWLNGKATLNSSGEFSATKVKNAVWNDYAECRHSNELEPGRCVTETSTEEGMIRTTERLMPGCKFVSDTYGTLMGETEEAKTPIAVSGRVLAYPYRNKEEYPLGAAVCSAPNGTIDIMTREEIMMYPERIVGTVSEIPDYDVWHGGSAQVPTDIQVNGRIWIYVR